MLSLLLQQQSGTTRYYHIVIQFSQGLHQAHVFAINTLCACIEMYVFVCVCVASRKRAYHRCWHTKSDKRLLTGIAHMGNQMWLKFNRPFDRVEWLRCEAWQATTKAEERTNRWTNKATAIAAASSHRKKIFTVKIPQRQSKRIVIVTFAYGLRFRSSSRSSFSVCLYPSFPFTLCLASVSNQYI